MAGAGLVFAPLTEFVLAQYCCNKPPSVIQRNYAASVDHEYRRGNFNNAPGGPIFWFLVPLGAPEDEVQRRHDVTLKKVEKGEAPKHVFFNRPPADSGSWVVPESPVANDDETTTD
jgi:hypothetical protein